MHSPDPDTDVPGFGKYGMNGLLEGVNGKDMTKGANWLIQELYSRQAPVQQLDLPDNPLPLGL